MNIVLRILVILTLVLNRVALWFSLALYGKRELLIDRNDSFREFVVRIAKTFEAAEPEVVNVASEHEARDISAVTLANADITPDRSDFWESYKQAYEKIDNKSYAVPSPRISTRCTSSTPKANPRLMLAECPLRMVRPWLSPWRKS